MFCVSCLPISSVFYVPPHQQMLDSPLHMYTESFGAFRIYGATQYSVAPEESGFGRSPQFDLTHQKYLLKRHSELIKMKAFLDAVLLWCSWGKTRNPYYLIG